MAKRKRKPKTPAPPRRAESGSGAGEGSSRTVQAPQVRKKQRDPAARDRRNRIILYTVAAAGIIGVIAAIIIVFVGRGGGGTSNAELNVDFSKLPGISHGPPPWQAEIDNLAARLEPMGLNPLPQEQLDQHKHQHLDIFDDGKRVKVPQFIGIDDSQFITELHTHDPLGIIHVESASQRQYSLGEFFGVWGVFLSKNCIGGLCATKDKPLKFYVDGSEYKGDPVTLPLKEHDEYAIVYGKPPKKIPSTYDFSIHGL